MKRTDRIALVIDWDPGVFLPSVVGPFSSSGEAAKWADLNVPNGTWEMKALAAPYGSDE